MEVNRKKLLVVGDRVLVTPEKGEGRTRVGLLLPQAAVEKMTVQGGHVVEVGPGTPVPNPVDLGEEPWRLPDSAEAKAQYVPMEANVGDYALFLRNAAVEIDFEGEQYLIVPYGAILLLIRENEAEDGEGPGAEFREEDFQL